MDIFIVYFLLASMFYTVVLTFPPTIIEALKNLVEYAKKRKNKGNLNEIADEAETKEILNSVTQEVPSPIGAFVTIAVLFFQIASMVHVKVQQKDVPQSSTGTKDDGNILKGLFDFFNFRFSVNQELCPSDDMNLPEKEFINIGLKVCSIFNLALCYFVWKCVVLDGGCKSNRRTDAESVELRESVEESRHNEQNRKLSFPSILKMGFIKLVKLNFTSISTFSIHMVHCVTINNISYLYFYASYQCYTWWQHVIMCALLPIVLLFPLSLGLSLNLLKEGHFSTSGFLIGSVFRPFNVTQANNFARITFSKWRRSCSGRSQRESAGLSFSCTAIFLLCSSMCS